MASHLLVMLVPLQLLAGLVFNPLTVGLGLLVAVPASRQRLRRVVPPLLRRLNSTERAAAKEACFERTLGNIQRAMNNRERLEWILAGVGIGLHTWMWLGTLVLLLTFAGGSPWAGLA
mmetsp:Transcript_50950/g.133974  ORF Transcript_50950/g.133974 Transcript_50950/m.133974 type:complete len:118 (-) Transcript_50950:3-356(-)